MKLLELVSRHLRTFYNSLGTTMNELRYAGTLEMELEKKGDKKEEEDWGRSQLSLSLSLSLSQAK